MKSISNFNLFNQKQIAEDLRSELAGLIKKNYA